MNTPTTNSLVDKYNIPGPRYTSYPTVPFWHNIPSQENWKELVNSCFQTSNLPEGISIYIHLPFCSSLCTYCGCNTRITKNHQVEIPYIETLLAEWQLYLDTFEEQPIIKEIHLGGGTPTFFESRNLRYLIEGVLDTAILAEDATLGIEGHPNNTTTAHLETLYDLGFRRLSLGIQDFDPVVQLTINRIQPYEVVQKVTLEARSIGFTSINFDLIFGLPYQTLESIDETITKVNQLRPNRIAFYSYAHIPWLKPAQKSFPPESLPNSTKKRAFYELGKQRFEALGYLEIGMDHFALPEEELAIAVQNKTLHRNFMGYTTHHTQLMVGLGASSISDSWTGFTQNVKKVEEYTSLVQAGQFPFDKGHILSTQDLLLRQHILNLMCNLETTWFKNDQQNPTIIKGLATMDEMEKDGLIIRTANKLTITPLGRPFVRNVCMCFDEYLWKKRPETQIFSQTI
jgi:oxygen-independent coproporphyrinogen-3 oxidase